MKKLIGSLLTAVVLVGCTTNPNAMRKSTPEVIYSTKGDAKDIAICIADGWETYGVVNQRATKNGYSMTLAIGGKLYYLADIEQDEDGITKTKGYKYRIYSLGKHPAFVTIAECNA